MRKITLLVISIVFVLSSVFQAYAEEIGQNEGWELQSFGVIAGDSSGLNTEGPLLRSHMVVILSQLYDKKSEAEVYSKTPSFSDIEVGMWYVPYIAYAEDKGWMSGFPDGTFRPNDVMSEQQVNALFIKVLGYKVDWNDINDFANELNIGVNSSSPNEVIRGEAFISLRKILDLKPYNNERTLGEVLGLKNYIAPSNNN